MSRLAQLFGFWVLGISLCHAADAPPGPYAALLAQRAKTWPPGGLDWKEEPAGSNPVLLTAIETPGHPDLIGLEQRMWIDADLAAVESVLDDVSHYKDLFPDFVDVHVVSSETGRMVTSWEQKAPFFLAPNTRYELIYWLDKSRKDRRIYRFGLKSSNVLKSDDGLIVIERVGARTRYVEYDFFDADWGIAKTLAPGRIWKDSVEGIYLSDLAIRAKAEHPDWGYPRIADETRKILERFPVAPVLEKKVRWR